MKYCLKSVFIFLVVAHATLLGQIPNTFTYQGFLTQSGAPIANGIYSLKFEIFDAASGGTLKHSETFPNVDIETGRFSVALGSTVPLAQVFTMPLFVEMTALSGPAGLTYPLIFSPRTALTSVPYALSSQSLVGPNSSAADGTSVAGGEFNNASAIDAAIGGGSTNTASGIASTIPGGNSNVASGQYSFAAGHQAKAAHHGAFVWADNSGSDFASTGVNQFLIRASGGVGIGTANPSTPLQVNGLIYSSLGGFKFPDGTMQTTAFSGGLSQWTTNGQDIYYNLGNVGIGTSLPNRHLTLYHQGSDFLNIQDSVHEILMGVDTTGGIVSVKTNDNLTLKTNNQDRIKITRDGNIFLGVNFDWFNTHAAICPLTISAPNTMQYNSQHPEEQISNPYNNSSYGLNLFCDIYGIAGVSGQNQYTPLSLSDNGGQTIINRYGGAVSIGEYLGNQAFELEVNDYYGYAGAIIGITNFKNNSGVWGYSSGNYGTGVVGRADGYNGAGVAGHAGYGPGSVGILGSANGYFAGFFYGSTYVKGCLTKTGGSFKIDHPLDPDNKYLYHSFVESPDMKNIYDGVVRLDTGGSATIILPDWFGALNMGYRYQLTAIGAPSPNLYIADTIANNRFRIAGGTPNARVSWMVTGIRQDAWANAHRIPVEEMKDPADRGKYISPVELGYPETKDIYYDMVHSHIPDSTRVPNQMHINNNSGGR